VRVRLRDTRREGRRRSARLRLAIDEARGPHRAPARAWQKARTPTRRQCRLRGGQRTPRRCVRPLRVRSMHSRCVGSVLASWFHARSWFTSFSRGSQRPLSRAARRRSSETSRMEKEATPDGTPSLLRRCACASVSYRILQLPVEPRRARVVQQIRLFVELELEHRGERIGRLERQPADSPPFVRKRRHFEPFP